jgi:hypothetical protein
VYTGSRQEVPNAILRPCIPGYGRHEPGQIFWLVSHERDISPDLPFPHLYIGTLSLGDLVQGSYRRLQL